MATNQVAYAATHTLSSNTVFHSVNQRQSSELKFSLPPDYRVSVVAMVSVQGKYKQDGHANECRYVQRAIEAHVELTLKEVVSYISIIIS